MVAEAPSICPVPLSETEAGFQALLASPSFRKAPTLRKLLEYLWAHRDENLSEYAIATDVLNRRPDFDPRTDSCVRVHILRLRQKLREYYETEGSASVVRFSVPPGSLRLNTGVVAEAESKGGAVVPAASRSLPLWPAIAAAAVIFAAVGWFFALRRVPAQASIPELPGFWKRVLVNGKPSRLVIQSPVFLMWPGRDLRIRDIRVNDWSQVAGSPSLKPLIDQYGSPAVSQSYSVAASSLAAATLAQYLAVRGNPVGIASEGQLGLDAFTHENLIFFGFPHTSAWLFRLLESCNFQMEENGTGLINRQPAAGEPSMFRESTLSPTRRVRPHVVSLLPGKERGANILLLGGQDPTTTPWLTSPSGIEAMDRAWERAGKPAWFESVIMAETEGDTLVRGTVSAFRAVSLSR